MYVAQVVGDCVALYKVLGWFLTQNKWMVEDENPVGALNSI